MANYALLKYGIQQVVKTNGNNEITGALLQQSLFAMIDSLGGYYQFAGIATPSTNPGTPDQNVYYIASTAGTYSNFNSIVLVDGEIAILKYNGTWSKDSSGAASQESVDAINKILELCVRGYFSKELVDYTASQKRVYCYGQFKAGERLRISITGTGTVVNDTIGIRYDDNTTIGYIKDGQTKNYVLEKDTEYIFFIFNISNFIQVGTLIANVLSGYMLETVEKIHSIVPYQTPIDTERQLVGVEIDGKNYKIKDYDIEKKILSANILDPSKLVVGFISNNKGEIDADFTSWRTTGFVDVSQLSGHTLYISRLWNGFYLTAFFYFIAFDENFEAIASSYRYASGGVANNFVVQSNYKYIRLTVQYYEGAQWQITDGSPSEFVTYNAVNRLRNCDYVLPDQIPSPGVLEEIQNEISGINETLDEHLLKNSIGDKISFNVNSGKLINLSGQIINGSAIYSVSDAIPVTPGKIYYITAAANYNKGLVAWYNGTTFIGGIFSPVDNSTLRINEQAWTCPSGVNNIRVANINNEQPVVNNNVIISSPDKFLKWTGLKWAAMGDSLTEINIRTTLHYFDYVSRETGISVINLGKSGTGYKKAYNTYLPFYQRVDTIPADADIITIFGSFNDLSAGDLGEITDTTDATVCGCINLTLDAIYNLYPTKPLGIITPTPWGGSLTGNYLNYVNALIAICEKRGIPYFDLFHCSNFHGDENFRVLVYSKDGTYSNSQQGVTNAIQVTAENIDTINAFLASGSTPVSIGDWVLPNLSAVHPNELGHKLIAPRFKAFLETLLL